MPENSTFPAKACRQEGFPHEVSCGNFPMIRAEHRVNKVSRSRPVQAPPDYHSNTPPPLKSCRNPRSGKSSLVTYVSKTLNNSSINASSEVRRTQSAPGQPGWREKLAARASRAAHPSFAGKIKRITYEVLHCRHTKTEAFVTRHRANQLPRID